MLLFDDKFEDLYPEEVEDWKKQQVWKQLDDYFAKHGFFLIPDWDEIEYGKNDYGKNLYNKSFDCICSCGGHARKSIRNFQISKGCRHCRDYSKPRRLRKAPSKVRILRRNYPDYVVWRTEVFRRDQYTCQICGAMGYQLAAHHLDGYSWCIDKRTDISNGITLCVSCHRQFHSTYGNRNNTNEQFAEFQKNFDENCVKTPL